MLGKKGVSDLKEWIRDLLVALAVALIAMQFVKPTIVEGYSMEPTLSEKNYIFLSKQQYTFSDIKSGQIVVFHSDLKSDDGEEKLLIKRVIAVPGDELEVTGGAVYLNGERLKENYIFEQYTTGFVPDFKIPDGKVFVMGDNRQHSADSRFPDVGLVPEEKIIGMAFLRVWPFNKFGFLN